jgi:hypothetical protein
MLKAYEYAERLSTIENRDCGLAKGTSCCIDGGAEHIHVKTKFVVL